MFLFCYLSMQVEQVPGARVSNADFTRFWINCSGGTISVGMGAPGTGPWHTWVDWEPLQDIQHVGLSAWDRHVAYRDIQMHPPITLDATSPPKVGGVCVCVCLCVCVCAFARPVSSLVTCVAGGDTGKCGWRGIEPWGPGRKWV
jgi:hypothetical protein